MKYLIFSLPILGILLVFLPSCSDANKARIEVATKSVLSKIDDILGKMDVQKTEIENGIKSASQAVDGIRKAKIRAQSQLEQLTEKVRPIEEYLKATDSTLIILREKIAADKPATFAGKTYSIDDLKVMAGKVIAAHKKTETEINGYKSSRETMTATVSKLAETQQKIENKLSILKNQVSKLDSEIAAAIAMKQASAAMGDANTSLSDNLNELEKKIATLSADVRAELTNESDRWSSSSTDKTLAEVDSFIKDSQKPAETLAEIDAVLGKKK